MSRSAESTIAGYFYQFDHSILQLLDPSIQSITIEGIEDIDVFREGTTEAIQVKYYNETKYSKSIIIDPLIWMIKDHKTKKENGWPTIKYTLYIYLGQVSPTLNEIVEGNVIDNIKNKMLVYSKKNDDDTETEINILEEFGLTEQDLTDFNFSLIKADKNLEEQRRCIKNILKEHFNCNSEAEIEYFYNNSIAVITDLACKKSQDGTAVVREIQRNTFLSKIDKKVFLFNKWYAAIKNSESYLNHLRKTLKRGKALDVKKNKFFFIGEEFFVDAHNYKQDFVRLVKNIISETYELDKAFSTKNKVSTVVLELTSDKIEELKKELANNEILFNDGNEHYGFSPKRFNELPITNTNKNDRLTKASFQIKIISLATFTDNWSNSKEKIQPVDTIIFFSNKDHNIIVEKITGVFESYIVPKSDAFNTFSQISELFDKLIISDDYFRVISVLPNLIQVEVTNPDKFSRKNNNMSLGSYIKITDENQISVIGILQSYKIKDINTENEIPTVEKKEPSFILDIQPVGFLENNTFERGGNKITIPPNEVEVADDILLNKIFTLADENKHKMFCIGTLSNYLNKDNKPLNIEMDGNKFFNKHIAVLGSTGSGKSCTVAKILQEGIKADHTEQQQKELTLNNSHVIIFDLHGEYKSAFKKGRHLSVKDLVLPYWLMNSEELQVFLLGSELEDGNKKNLIKKLITENKKFHYSGSKEQVTYDLPIYFNIDQVRCYLDNLNDSKRNANFQVEWRLPENAYQEIGISTETTFKEDTTITKINGESISASEILFKYKCINVHTTQTDFNGKLAPMLTKLETQLNDERLDFLFKRAFGYKTEDLKTILSQFLGHQYNLKNTEEENKQSNITIIDLSGIPFEVLNITVALISRLIFSFSYYWKKWNDQKGNTDTIKNPFLLVYEEAHNYIPKTEEVKYKSVREAVERIAKEGRKYGLSAMIISQRPSEISETILSQCNTFVIMRITNPTDQNYIKRLLPDTLSGITDSLSVLQPREALIIGETIPIPTLLKINDLDKDNIPKSNDVPFIEKWRLDWNEMPEIDEILTNMTQK